MMYKLILLQLLLFTIVAGANDALNELHSLQQNSDKPCLDNAFAFCQVQFNDELKISESLFFDSGSDFFNAVNKLLENAKDIQAFLKVCRARKSFYFCMHSMYSSCINPYYLLTKADVSLKNVMDYIRVWNNLDFMCNGGFEELVNRYQNIISATGSSQYRQCLADFRNSLLEAPRDRCKIVDVLSKCAQAAFKNAHKSEAAAWWICEDLRVSYGSDCPDLRCHVKTD